MTQLVLQAEKLVQRHVQKAVELAQHLFGSLAKRHTLGRQVNKYAPFIFCLPSPRHQSLRLTFSEPLKNWALRARFIRKVRKGLQRLLAGGSRRAPS
jgi:hypothetical protein